MSSQMTPYVGVLVFAVGVAIIVWAIAWFDSQQRRRRHRNNARQGHDDTTAE